MSIPARTVYKSRAAALAATLLISGMTGLSAGISVTLGDLERVYDGTPQAPLVATDPVELPVELTYRKLGENGAPESCVAVDNIPASLALSYSSISFASNGMCGMGKYFSLGGAARQIEAVDVVMVTWAKAEDFPLLSAINPEGYFHPVTLTLYQLTDSNQLVYLTETTKPVLVPWRPVALPDGSPYPHNGIAFPASFDLNFARALPQKVVALVSYDTSRAGFTPLVLPGPYDQLNVAITTRPPAVGGDADPGAFLKIVWNPLDVRGSWHYPDTSLGNKSPMMRIRTLSSRSSEAPCNAGSYEVSASLAGSTFPVSVVGNLAIAPALAEVRVEEQQEFYTGAPVTPRIVTTPPGLPVTTLCDGRDTPPTAVGAHAISSVVADPNYLGQGAGTLTILPSVRSWLEEKVAAGAIPAAQAENGDDPDGDGLSNLLEYAFNSNPGSASLLDAAGPLAPALAETGALRKLVYRRNSTAADLTYRIESSPDLGASTWSVIECEESVVSDDGETQVVEATLPAEDGDRRFYRLRVEN